MAAGSTAPAPGSFADYLGVQTPPNQQSVSQQAVKPDSKAPIQAPGASLPINPVLQPLTQALPDLMKTYTGDQNAPVGSPESMGAGAKMWNDIVEGAKNLSNIPSDIQKEGLANSLLNPLSSASGDLAKGLAKAGGRTALDFVGTVFAPLGAIVGTGIKMLAAANPQAAANTQKNIDAISNFISDSKAVQDFSLSHPNAGEDFNRFQNFVLSQQETGQIDPVRMAKEASDLAGKISEAAKAPLEKAGQAIDTTGEAIQNAPAKVQSAFENQIFGTPEEQAAKAQTKLHDAINTDAGKIADIEMNYSKLRRANEFSPDADASRQRISASNVLANSVDDNGTIHTKGPGGAAEQYKAATLDKAEGVVRKALVREGGKVSLDIVRKTLTDNVMNSRLEGADLKNALNMVKKEVSGLALRADSEGNVPLETVHDAKINQTNNINYQTPPEVSAARKAIARGMKTTIEDTSNLNIKDINGVLSKYLEDVGRLEALDGRKVKGGRLGKYASQIGGNIAGGIAGDILGGPAGSIAGTVVGGEIASFIRGKIMAGTFGEIPGAEVTQDPILTSAIKDANSPRLALPAPAEGSPRSQTRNPGVIPLSPKAASTVDASEAPIRTGSAPVDAERMSLAESASTQEEKDAIQELTPEEVTALNQITDKSIKAQMVKAYLESTQSTKAAILSENSQQRPKSTNNSIIRDTLPDKGKESSPVKGDIVKLQDMPGTFKVMGENGKESFILKDTKTGRNITVGKNNIIKK